MRILGIDLGNTSVKAVEIDTSFGRYEVHEYHEQPVAIGEDPAQTAARLVAALPKAPDRVAMTLRTRQVTFRNLQIPSRDKKVIASSVGFELDDELPFSIEQAAFEYSVLSQTGPSTHVHVAATPKRNLAAFIEQVQTAGVDPDLITTEAWASRTLLNRILKTPGAQDHPVLLIQIGHERTIFYVHWRGFPVLAREISWGGRDLTHAIATHYGIPLEKAESTKRDSGFVLTDSQRESATPEQLEFSKVMEGALRPLLQEVHQTELTCKNITHEKLSSVFLAGGSSLIPGLAHPIATTFQLPVAPLNALSAIAASGVTYSDHADAGFALAAGAALCLVSPARGDRSATINLRKGFFAKRGLARELNWEAFKKPAIATGAVLASLFASMFVQSQIYDKRIVEANTQLERAVRGFFGTVANSAIKTYIASPKTLTDSINKELGKQREINKLAGTNPRSPIDFLKDLSASIPKDTVVDLVRYQVGAAPAKPYSPDEAGLASLTFIVSNPQMVERLQGLLQDKMEKLERGKVEEVAAAGAAPAADGSPAATQGQGAPVQKWKVTFTGKPLEAAYGK